MATIYCLAGFVQCLSFAFGPVATPQSRYGPDFAYF